MPAQSEAHRFTYLQLAEQLRQEIASGTYPMGERLPSIRDLAESFGVAIATVQKALSVLSDEGAVKPGSTRGYFAGEVHSTPPLAALRETQRIALLESQVMELRGQVAGLTERLSALESGRG